MIDAVTPPSVVLYTFADRLEPRPPDDAALAQLLIAVAAWALAEQDTIDLAPLPHPRPVDGRLAFNRLRAYAPQPGLEGRLLHSMTGKGKETRGISVLALLTIGLPVGFETEARHDSLRYAIETGPWRTRRPHRAVLRICGEEARRAGATRRFGRGPRADRLPELEINFAEVRSRWQRFQSQHPELHAALMDDCAAGLRPD
ncbi:MAG TPA: hypothetical protein VF545_09175 [Thermoleophilaceae bacterium]